MGETEKRPVKEGSLQPASTPHSWDPSHEAAGYRDSTPVRLPRFPTHCGLGADAVALTKQTAHVWAIWTLDRALELTGVRSFVKHPHTHDPGETRKRTGKRCLHRTPQHPVPHLLGKMSR